MSNIRTGFNLTSQQKEAIKNAYMRKRPMTLRLTSNQMSGGDMMGLTKTQMKNVQYARNKKTGLILKISKSQLLKQGAGWLSGLIPMITKNGTKNIKISNTNIRT